MIVVMNSHSSPEHLDQVIKLLDQMGLNHAVIDGASRKVVEVLGGNGRIDPAVLENAPMVDRVLNKPQPFLAAGRRPDERTREVPLGVQATIGGAKLGIIAGPCSVETQSQLLEIAAAVKEAGAVGLRGGAFKPRTSPYSFQGHGERGLEMLALAREQTGLAVVTEVMRCEHVELVARYADVLQIGSRSMHDTHLLSAAGRQSKPVLLKRGWSATLDEFLLAAEYIMLEGNHNVILCERGIRTHETFTRNTLSLAVVPEIKRISTLPIIVDPSHGTGRNHLVAPMSNAAIACGADGLIIEVHPTPSAAWTDGSQSLDPDQFRSLMDSLKPFAAAARRDL
jgi:3-deoxy-7-phosphoheptulonate synthase